MPACAPDLRTASRNEHQTADYPPVKRKNAHAIRSSGAICIPDGAILEFRIVVRSVLPVVLGHETRSTYGLDGSGP